MGKIIRQILSGHSRRAASHLATRHGGKVVASTICGQDVFGVAECGADEETAMECVWFALTGPANDDGEPFKLDVVKNSAGIYFVDVWQD